MKLRRIISALVVFTLVMTSAVCSVSAAGTYNVTTVYDVATDEITVNAVIAGGTGSSMVSYILYTGDAVAEDGGNIVHIDQATLDASGNAGYDAVTAPFTYFDGAKVKFTSTAGNDDLAADKDGSYLTRVESVSKITDIQTGITLVDKSDNGESTKLYYVTADGNVSEVVNQTVNYATNNASKLNIDGWYAGDKTAGVVKSEDGESTWYGMSLVPLSVPTIDTTDDPDEKSKVVAWIVDVGQSKNRDTGINLKFEKETGSLNGVAGTKKTFSIYDNSDNDPNLMINGRYKDDVSDGWFGPENDGIKLEGGALISISKGNNPGYENASTSHIKGDFDFDAYNASAEEKGYDKIDKDALYSKEDSEGVLCYYTDEACTKKAMYKTYWSSSNTPDVAYMTIDSRPIYTKHKTSFDTYDAVTFLVTAKDAETAKNAGLHIRVYPNGTVSQDKEVAASTEVVMDYGIFANAYEVSDGKFGIMLYDSARSGYFNSENYDIEATPVIKDSNGEWVELSIMGDNPVDGENAYFVVNRGVGATGSDSSSSEVSK